MLGSQSVLYLVPDLLGPPSGIARYCRMVCRALVESDAALTTVALLDSAQAVSEATTLFPGMRYVSCRGSRPEFVRQALATAMRQRPTLILIGHANFAALGWLLARLTGAHFVTFMYGVDVWEPLRPTRRLALQRSDRTISISRFTAQQAERANQIPPAKVRVLHNCLPPAFEHPVQLETSGARPSMLTVARMTLVEQYKGHDVVIRAMPALLSRFPQLIYHVVGQGDGRPALETLAAQTGVAHAVRFHGVVSEEVLCRLYTEASLYIMPSRGEGFGFAFIEAMSQGTPAIGGNVDAAPEVIVDGETGYVIDPTSVEAVIAAASRLLGDKALRERMGQAARQDIEHRFGFPQFRQRLTSYLAELLPASGMSDSSD